MPQPNHSCDQIENLAFLKKDVENIKENVTEVKSKQERLEENLLEIRDFRTLQMETNKYLSKVVEQNNKLIEKLDSKYEKIELKYENDVKETKEKIHNLELTIKEEKLAMQEENAKQDTAYNKDKVTAMLKALGWTLGVIGTLVGIIWKLILPMLG